MELKSKVNNIVKTVKYREGKSAIIKDYEITKKDSKASRQSQASK